MTPPAAARMVPIGKGTGSPLLFLPPVSGSAFWCVGLVRALPRPRPAFAIEAPGLDAGDPCLSIESFAGAVRVAAARVLADPTTVLIGYSMGGTTAFEVARQVSADGGSVGGVVLIDADAPDPPSPSDDPGVLRQYLFDVAHTLDLPAPPPGIAEPLIRTVVTAPTQRQWAAALYDLMTSTGLMPESIDSDFVARRYTVFQAHMRALERYRPGPYAGLVAVINAADSPDHRAAWAALSTEELRGRTVPGDHYSMWRPTAAAVATALDDLLTADLATAA